MKIDQTVRSILRKHLGTPAVKRGGDAEAQNDGNITFGGKPVQLAPVQREALIAELQDVKRHVKVITYFWLAVLAVILLASIAIIANNLHNMTALAAVVLGDGAALWGLLGYTSSLHKRTVATGILIALIPNLPEAELPRVANVLLEEVFRKD